MSYPFGGHPTLGDFLSWLEQEGCTVATNVRTSSKGRGYTSIEISSSTGSRLAIVDVPQDERLAPSTVSHYLRRLGIKKTYGQSGQPVITKP